MKYIFIYLITMAGLVTITGCNHKKERTMEQYDFEYMERVKKAEAETAMSFDGLKQKGDTLIIMSAMTEIGTYYDEYPPAPAFYKMQKNFYPNGVLESKGKVIGFATDIGIWQHYNQKGYLVKEVDEDAKFGAIKPEWILDFLHQRGYINKETGEGREVPYRINEWGGGRDKGHFTLYFTQKDEIYHCSVWDIIISPGKYSEFYLVRITIHGETGEILKEERFNIIEE